ncbi:recombinase zinc beta ribbon domain-containing protein [Candidatus Fermentibacterales bacterium]|nr:recombinase zinc beta ribbon domain-containing protein [Candidatus Fermentibacterales bacterium]
MAEVRSKGSPYLLSGGLFVCRRCGENMTSHINRGRRYYLCGSSAYRRGLGCGEGFQVRKEDIERAVVDEVGRMFKSCSNSKRLRTLISNELRTQANQDRTELNAINDELARMDKETANIRRAVKDGLDDLEWANSELHRLRAERKQMEARRSRTEKQPEPPALSLKDVENYMQSFSEVLANGTKEERREFIRLFVKKVELDPVTGDIMITLLSRPPGLRSRDTRTPASRETGVQIGLVAGAGFEPATFGL